MADSHYLHPSYHAPSTHRGYPQDPLLHEPRLAQGSSLSIERYDHASYSQGSLPSVSYWSPQLATLPTAIHYNPPHNPLPPLHPNPTLPSTMAIPPQHHLPPPPTPPPPPPLPPASFDDNPGEGEAQTSQRVRHKRHACWMCHKSFDRPSTLKKVPIPVLVPLHTQFTTDFALQITAHVGPHRRERFVLSTLRHL